jgi:hypothetical protein
VSTFIERAVAAIEGLGLRAASERDDAEHAHDVCWSLIARRGGADLEVLASRDPSTFAAMAHQRPKTVVPLDGLDAVEGLRALARAFPLPEDSRAIPVVLLEGSTAQRVCGVAMQPPLEASVCLVGHGANAELQAVVLGASELAVVGVDGYSERFGRVTLRRPTAALRRVDVDARALTLQFDDLDLTWRLRDVPADDVDALLAWARRLDVPVRRLVSKGPGVREWEVAG